VTDDHARETMSASKLGGGFLLSKSCPRQYPLQQRRKAVGSHARMYQLTNDFDSGGNLRCQTDSMALHLNGVHLMCLTGTFDLCSV